ncbi:replication factor C subunit 1 [Desmophyllum pertusum]|uniref:Replication factor C subunit 1 n=1 Tax=Desmophyllum pertusum TaxID=174260 RepID=A0A9W9Z0J1_9CNID|nr:replication factor C subunit 1 [Desmophyllum pertusum]
MDIRSVLQSERKDFKPAGASKVEDKRGKDSSKPLSKPDIGKSKAKSRVLSSSEDDEVTRKQKRKESQKRKAENVLDSDSDEDPLPPKIRKATSANKVESSKPKKSRRPINLEDSDEEEVVPQKLKKSAKQTETKTSKEVVRVKESPIKPKEIPKVTSAADFFGSTPVERVSRKVFAAKRKQRSDEPEDEELLKNKDKESLNGKEKGRKENENLNGRTTQQPSKKRKEDSSGPQLEVKKPSPSKKQRRYQRPRPPAGLQPRQQQQRQHQNQQFLKLQLETPNRVPRKTITPTKENKGVVKESPNMKTPKTSKTDEKGEIPPSLEKKKSSYRSFMSRDGPSAIGSKPIPEGEENCLEGMTFVITGVLESIERDDAADLIQRYGGKVTQSVSKKTSYIVVGRDAGESKLSKAKQLRTTQLDEDGLFELVKTKPGKKTSYEPPSVEKKSKKKAKEEAAKTLSQGKDQFEGESSQLSQRSTSSPATQTPTSSPAPKGEPSLLWVDKYRPRTVKQIIGQQGDKSNMRKLMNWLRDWEKKQKETSI